MRLISQDGKIDIPYELFAIGITNDNSIVAVRDAIARPSEIAQGILAKYTTEAKAIKAMEMMRAQYMKLGMIKILASGTCEYMDRSLEKDEKMEVYTDYCRKHCFKFPADDEIEV